MLFFNLIIIGSAIAIMVAPDWVYNAGRTEKVEVPAKWKTQSKIIGAIFLLIGLVFLLFNLL